MSTNAPALVLHPAALLAKNPHKHSTHYYLHKTAESASAIIHGPNHEGVTALVFIAFVVALLYAIWITFIHPSSS